MKIPRHAGIWLPGYLQDRWSRWLSFQAQPKRLWVAITDHYEPFWRNTDEPLARQRVDLWRQHWPAIARRHPDSSGQPARYSFFYPEEEYRPELLDTLADMTRQGIGDVEIHLHHDGEGKQNFLDRMGGFIETLWRRHGLLRTHNGRVVFGFIHGNWALDNSRPDGRWCGLNDEITLLKAMGCYADFTMPSGPGPTQARLLNTIYWAQDDPDKPKSYDRGAPLNPGDSEADGCLLMIPGPFGLRWGQGRVTPRIECAEVASQDLATPYRVRRWLDLSPRIGGDLFLKLHTHGTQEKNSAALLLNGGLDRLYSLIEAECARRGILFYFVSAWQMWQAVDALRRKVEPVP